MTGEAIEAQVLRFLRGHPGSSLRDVRTAIRARNERVDEALRALNLARRASCTDRGWFALRRDGTRVGRANGKRPSGRQVAYGRAVHAMACFLHDGCGVPWEAALREAACVLSDALPVRQREQHP